MLLERCFTNVVDPIKSLDDIRKIKEYLSKKPRNALLFSFGINSGLRISDILALNVEDVRGKEYIEIREKKTNKRKVFPINAQLSERIYLFPKIYFRILPETCNSANLIRCRNEFIRTEKLKSR